MIRAWKERIEPNLEKYKKDIGYGAYFSDQLVIFQKCNSNIWTLAKTFFAT